MSEENGKGGTRNFLPWWWSTALAGLGGLALAALTFRNVLWYLGPGPTRSLVGLVCLTFCLGVLCGLWVAWKKLGNCGAAAEGAGFPKSEVAGDRPSNPTDVCRCGHWRSRHWSVLNQPAEVSTCLAAFCPCRRFRLMGVASEEARDTEKENGQ